MKETKTGKIRKIITTLMICSVIIMFFSISVLAASPYEVTKSGGALIRTSYAESAASVRRASQGSILWVQASKKNSAGNTWYQLTDGYWIYSGNVKKHSCIWSWVSGYNPTCTSNGVTNYRCNKCGQTKSVTSAAYGHKYESNVCKTCGAWNTSSLKSRSYLSNVKYYVTTNGAKVHSGPYGGCSTVTTLSKGTEIYVTEKIVNASNNTWYRYNGGYIFSDYVVLHSSCSWNSGTVTKKATCTSTGTKVQYCTICGKSKTTTLAKVSHKYDDNVCTVCGGWNTSSLKSKTAVNNVKYYVTTNGAKVHSGPYGGCNTVKTLSRGAEIYVTEKIVNASKNTWYKYSDGYIFSDYVVAHNTCSWNSGNVTKKATCTSAGTKIQYCTICGKSKTTTLAKASHKYDDNVCIVCGGWNTSSLKSKSTVNNVKYCVVSQSAKVRSGPYEKCSAVKTLSKGTDIIVTEKVVNASGNTWYKYSGGYIFSEHVKKHSSCSWNSGTVTKKATCTSTGTKVQYCTICGKSKTTTLAKVSHKYEDNVCTVCGGWNTSSLKSKTAVNNLMYYVIKDDAKVHSGPYGGCKTVKTFTKGMEFTVTEKVVNASKNTWYKCSDGYVFSDYVKAHNTCSWNSGSVTKKATCKNTGTKVQKCTICGKSKTTTLAKVSHKYDDNVCTVCGGWNTSSLKSKSTVNNVKYYVVKDGAKVHSGPYGGCKTVKTFTKGTEFTVTEKVVNASKNTWYKCSDGYVFSDYVKAHNSCSWNSGSVTKKATCKNTGTKVQKCTVCGKSKTITLDKTGHKYEDNVCTVCGGWDKSSLKSKSAVKNIKYYVVEDGAKAHSGPYGGCKTVKTLKKGTVITVTEKVVNAGKNTWYKFSDGYIYGKYVKDYALYTAKITLNAEEATLYVGQSKTLKATVKGPSATVTWKSSDDSVATVDSKGKITGKKTGSCTITAKANGKTDTCKITVKQLAAPKDVTIIAVDTARTFKVSHKAVSGADGYEVTYKGALEIASKAYTETSTSVSVSKSDSYTFKCYVRAYKLIDGKKYYGKKSQSYDVHVHNAKDDIAAKKTVKYSAVDVDYTNHLEKITNSFVCAGCKKNISYTKSTEKKHSFTCGVCQTCGKEQASDYVVGKFYPTIGNGPSYSSSEKKDGKTPIYAAAKYSDKLFEGKTTSFNKNICLLSAIGASASYTQKFGKSFLTECGFKKVEAENSSEKASSSGAGKNDHARYIIGYKKLSGTDKTLVAVLVNGYTKGDYEWVSNFNVGKSGLHEGLSKAADEITAKVNAYIKAQGINSSKLKIWITGHSRGGAVTGMSAVKLSKKYGVENVFAYGFATPNGVPNSTAKNTNSKNIFNIINPGDFVPFVVPSSWGFTKYGSVKSLSVDSAAKKYYKSMSKDTYDGLTESGRKDLINAFCDYSPSRKAYYSMNKSASPSYFGRALGLFLSDAGLCTEVVELLGKCSTSDGDSIAVLGQMIYNGGMTTNIHEAHCMETYIAILYSEYT